MNKLQYQVEEYIDYCRNIKRLQPLSVRNNERTLTRFANGVRAKSVQALTNEEIDEWICSGNKNGTSMNTYRMQIKTFLRYFIRKGEKPRHVDLNRIVRSKETPKRKVYYSAGQIQQVLNDCDDLEWLLIKICFDCGIRLRELTFLTLDNIDGRKIAFVGKGGKPREAYIDEITRQRLNDWIVDNKITDRLWIRNYKNGSRLAYCPDTIARKMNHAFWRNGFSDFHPHALRHSFATQICRNGAPIEVAKEMLGHSNIQTTEIYVHSLEGRLEDLFMKYKYA